MRGGLGVRVVIVSDFGSVNGGAAKVAIESARGLAEAGVDVVFAYAVGPVSDKLNHPLIRLAKLEGVEIWQVKSKLAAARQGVWNKDAYAFLKELLGAQPKGETVVHLHQWSKAFSPAAIAAAAESSLPLLYTLHEYFAFCPNGAYFDYPAGKACARAPMSAGCVMTCCDRASYAHKLVRVARQAQVSRAFAAAPQLTFIHVSAFARDFSEPFLPKSAHHVVVENMMEAARRPAVDPGANAHALYLGRFTQEKGVEALARAAARVGMPIRFLGDGPYEAQIRAANPKAEIVSWVAPEKVFNEIAAARCVVAPSLWFETGPLVVAEAKALGVPIIVSRQTGAAQFVEDGVDGFLTPTGDEEALAKALARLNDAETTRAMGERAYAGYWSDPLTLDRHVARTVSAYRQALGLPGELRDRAPEQRREAEKSSFARCA
jgi:glycosyltransferase involved in cell wall biosynthesis